MTNKPLVVAVSMCLVVTACAPGEPTAPTDPSTSVAPAATHAAETATTSSLSFMWNSPGCTIFSAAAWLASDLGDVATMSASSQAVADLHVALETIGAPADDLYLQEGEAGISGWLFDQARLGSLFDETGEIDGAHLLTCLNPPPSLGIDSVATGGTASEVIVALGQIYAGRYGLPVPASVGGSSTSEIGSDSQSPTADPDVTTSSAGTESSDDATIPRTSTTGAGADTAPPPSEQDETTPGTGTAGAAPTTTQPVAPEPVQMSLGSLGTAGLFASTVGGLSSIVCDVHPTPTVEIVIEGPAEIGVPAWVCVSGFTVGEPVDLAIRLPDGSIRYDMTTVPSSTMYRSWPWRSQPHDPAGSYEVTAVQGPLVARDSVELARPTVERMWIFRPPSAVGPVGTTFAVGFAGFTPHSALDVYVWYEEGVWHPLGLLGSLRANESGVAQLDLLSDGVLPKRYCLNTISDSCSPTARLLVQE